jgi:uncharacterized protein (TIGR02996 family)
MGAEHGFLDAIWESPDDDVPRLVYADWLEEQGNPRGQFMRIQCALARGDLEEDRRRQLERQEQELLAVHGQEWLGPTCSPRLFWRFRRGFPVAMQGMFRQVAGRYTDYLRFFPNEQVRLGRARAETTPAEVADWLTDTGTVNHYQGRYAILHRVSQIDIAFSVAGQSEGVAAIPGFGQAAGGYYMIDVGGPVTIDCSGTLQRERLRLSWQNQSGKRGRTKYRLVLRPDGAPW